MAIIDESCSKVLGELVEYYYSISSNIVLCYYLYYGTTIVLVFGQP